MPAIREGCVMSTVFCLGGRLGRRGLQWFYCCAIALFSCGTALADTTINVTNRYAYGANIGWMDARGDAPYGASIGLFYSSGYLWSGNVGWIKLGSGTPTNGYKYANNSATDWGINMEAGGALRGYAYGANIGWVNFEAQGNPRVDLVTGALSGYAWGANVGWIGLSNAYAYVKTDWLDWGPDTDNDGIPDPFEYKKTGNLTNLTHGGDFDGDDYSDRDEFLADTDPMDANSLLEITKVARDSQSNAVTWTVSPTRTYVLEQVDDLTNGAVWVDSGLGVMSPGSGSNLTGIVSSSGMTTRVYRARAIMPLAPP